MFKSVFSKYFAVISLIIVVGFTAMTGLHMVLFAQSLGNEKKALLTDSAENISRLIAGAAVQSEAGNDGVTYHLDKDGLTPFLGMISRPLGATVLVTDRQGAVLLCSDGVQSVYIGSRAPSASLPEEGFSSFSVGTVGDMFPTRQYVAVSAVRIRDRVLGYVFVTSPTETVWATLENHLRVYLLSALGALALSCVVVYLMTYRIVRPLKQMAAATRRFAQGDFSARLSVKGKDEVAELADALNHMAVSLSSVETMRRSFIANVSHELKTPMTTIAGFVDGMLDGTIPPEKQPQYMKVVSDEVKRLSRLVRSMLDLSRIDSGELKLTTVRMDLTEVVGSVLIASEQRIEQKHLRITGLEDCGKFEIDGDYDLLNQALYNLIDNAIKFTDDGGEIDIRLSRRGNRVYCAIRNTGDGIPPEEMPQIFERFYKSDRSRSLDRNGMGLGLFIVKTVIGLHHGMITVRSVEKEFTEFSFWLPAPAATDDRYAHGTVQ